MLLPAELPDTLPHEKSVAVSPVPTARNGPGVVAVIVNEALPLEWLEVTFTREV